MAISALFLIRIKRMIERLRDPHRLNETEQLHLDSMLNLQERVDVERRYTEQVNINSLMSMQLGYFPTFDEMWWGDLYCYHEVVLEAKRSIPSIESYTSGRWERVELARKMNYRDKGILIGAVAHAEEGDAARQRYVDDIYRVFDGLTGQRKLYLEHRGPRTFENRPVWVESLENVAWPNHPNARRQATIEVLEIKLAGLNSTVVNAK
jgi:hypothetical protein